MNWLMMTAVGIFAFSTGIMLHYFLSLRRALRRAQSELDELGGLVGKSRNTRTNAEEPYIRMLVEVKNPIALAHRESPVAKLASGTAPNLVIKKVYEQVVAQTKDQLREKNVEAEVSIVVL